MEKNLASTESPKTEQPIFKLTEVSVRLIMNEEEEPHKLMGLAFYNDKTETKVQILTAEQTLVIVDMIKVLAGSDEEEV